MLVTYLYVGLAVFLIGALCGARPDRLAQWPLVAALVILLWPVPIAAAILNLLKWAHYRYIVWRLNRD